MHYLGDISPTTLGIEPFLLTIAMMEMGGVGRFPGAVLGAVIIVFGNEFLRLAGTLRLALLGLSGTVVGLDYRGVKVLAAHEPVGELNLGIVAKIDLSEIRAPFIKAGLLSALIASFAIALGAVVFIKITEPILVKLRQAVAVLEKALKEVKTLRGIVPICSFCKKIRNDKGYWDQVEVYVREHTEADFSHGICPACMKQHYPDLVDR